MLEKIKVIGGVVGFILALPFIFIYLFIFRKDLNRKGRIHP